METSGQARAIEQSVNLLVDLLSEPLTYATPRCEELDRKMYECFLNGVVFWSLNLQDSQAYQKGAESIWIRKLRDCIMDYLGMRGTREALELLASCLFDNYSLSFSEYHLPVGRESPAQVTLEPEYDDFGVLLTAETKPCTIRIISDEELQPDFNERLELLQREFPFTLDVEVRPKACPLSLVTESASTPALTENILGCATSVLGALHIGSGVDLK